MIPPGSRRREAWCCYRSRSTRLCETKLTCFAGQSQSLKCAGSGGARRRAGDGQSFDAGLSDRLSFAGQTQRRNAMAGPGDAAPSGDDGELDPRAAALLLANTQRQARRALDFRSPRLSLLGAAAALAAFGAIWLSVRGQHPYKGPTPAGLVVLYVIVAMRIGTFVYARRRAMAGVSGGSLRQQRAEAVAVAAALIAVYLVMAALAHAGASDSVVYGVYVGT